MDELVFLGTGGGRFTTLFQARATGGLIYKTSGVQIHIDPGPGALLRCKECKVYPFKTSVLMATHSHLDHINDLNLMIEGMTNAATRKRGTLITIKEVLNEVVTDYHKRLIKEVVILEPGQSTAVNGLKITGVKCEHGKTKSIGFKFQTPDYCFYYSGDTNIYPGFEKNLEGVDILLANVIRPGDKKLYYHTCTNDLISALKNTKHEIKLIIINHFGTLMLREGPEKEAKRIMNETGVKTIAATDGLRVKLRKKLTG
jgi:ribonuclease BN (tRNA processing enzyme)